MSREEFSAVLLTEFPELTDEGREDKGLLHVQMSAFAAYTETAIAHGDLAAVERCFALAHHAFHNADATSNG